VTLVLIVDDSEPNRKLERDILRNAGFEILESATGAEALMLANGADPGHPARTSRNSSVSIGPTGSPSRTGRGAVIAPTRRRAA